MKDMLPLMMMSGGMGGAGGAGGMDPMMMMMLMDDSDDSSTKTGCDDKHKVDHAFTSAGKITGASAIRAAVVDGTITGPTIKSTWETEYLACLNGATSEGSTSSSSSMKDLLPLMMMSGGMGGAGGAGGMDPMMMMMLMD